MRARQCVCVQLMTVAADAASASRDAATRTHNRRRAVLGRLAGNRPYIRGALQTVNESGKKVSDWLRDSSATEQQTAKRRELGPRASY
jgi:hypothetical protein